MDFQALFDFLQDLDRNNHKEWMDANRSRYRRLRNDFITWLDHLDATMAETDPDYYSTPGKRGINRINNNLLYHPNKPVYKDHFGAGLDKAPGATDFYIHIGIRECLLAGGVWRPSPARLKKVREAIDYDGEVLQEILDQPGFKSIFGELYPDQELTRMPKGYATDHPHADLLRKKTLAVVRPLTRDQVLSADFESLIMQTYEEMLPFRRYLNRALLVEE